MAGKERKTILLKDPSKKGSTTLEWKSFGWVVESVYDRIKAEKPHVPGSGYHHLELNFERDMELKNYAELKSLEEQYKALLPNSDDVPKNPGVFSLVMMVISYIVGALILFMGIYDAIVIWIVVGVVFILLGVRVLIRRKRFKLWEAANKVYQANRAKEELTLSEAMEKRADILEKAKSLL